MKAKINRLQYFFAIPNIMYSKAIGITAGITVRVVGGDAWISMTIGLLAGTVMVLLMTFVVNKSPDKTIIEYTREILGKGFSRLLGIILTVYFAVTFAISSNVVLLHLKEYLLPETPFLILAIIFNLLCTYAVYLGIEVVLRFALFGFIMNMGINITMMSGTIGDFKFVNLRPFFENGILADLKGSIYVFTDVTLVILAIGIIYPMLNNKKSPGALTFISMIIGIISIMVWPFFEIAVLGADVMKQFVVVCMQQVRSAQLTVYLPRYELIMVSFFVWGAVVQSTVMLFCTQYCFKQVTGGKKDKMILLGLTIILIPVTYILGFDHNKYISFLSFPWTQISLGLGVGIPIFMLVLSLIKSGNNKIQT